MPRPVWCRSWLFCDMMSKSERVQSLLPGEQNGNLSPNYTGFFERFNRREFFEAHDVLEQLWLKDKYGPDGLFYKGLIQLAGAFVHVQKSRTGPALALLRLARGNLCRYPGEHERLNVPEVLDLIGEWERLLSESAPLQLSGREPKLALRCD